MLDGRRAAARPAARYVIKHTTRTARAIGRGGRLPVDVDTLARTSPPTSSGSTRSAACACALGAPLVVDPYARNRAHRQLHPDRRGDERHGRRRDDPRRPLNPPTPARSSHAWKKLQHGGSFFPSAMTDRVREEESYHQGTASMSTDAALEDNAFTPAAPRAQKTVTEPARTDAGPHGDAGAGRRGRPGGMRGCARRRRRRRRGDAGRALQPPRRPVDGRSRDLDRPDDRLDRAAGDHRHRPGVARRLPDGAVAGAPRESVGIDRRRATSATGASARARFATRSRGRR